jgi:hypothetical protein
MDGSCLLCNSSRHFLRREHLPYADAGPKVGTYTFGSPDALRASSIEKEDRRKALTK